MKKERINEIWGVLFLLLGLYTLASLIFYRPEDIGFYASSPASPVFNYAGVIGAYIAFGLNLAFGISSYLIPSLFLVWAACFFMQRVPEKKVFKFIGLGIALFSMAVIVTISVEESARFAKGGALGYLVGNHLIEYFGTLGSYILAGSCLLLSLLLATDFLLYPVLKVVFTWLAKWYGVIREKVEVMWEGWVEAQERYAIKHHADEKPKKVRGKKEKPQKQKFPETPIKVKTYRPDLPDQEEVNQKAAQLKKAEEKSNKPKDPAPAPKPTKINAAQPSEDEGKHDDVIGTEEIKEGDYIFPTVDLLDRPKAGVQHQENLQEKSRIIEQTLAEFGIDVRVVEVEQGPVVARYELLPAPGVKVSSIGSYSDDLALALKAKSVRLIIPIPGKSAVGVEVPNTVSAVVSQRELIESGPFKSKKQILPLVLGKNTSGKPLIADLTSMPHILIAGTTGSGKTVSVNAIIAGLLYSCSPAELKFIMVDPKMVELAVYNKIPHMLTPVVTEVKKAAATLNWVVNEMDNRYKLLATVGVRNIASFNSRDLSDEDSAQIEEAQENGSENVIPAKLPYIVVIIDELADLMMVARDKVEGSIARLAQLSRAVGIHLILATQRPSVDVITGVIKANFPARISFKVASKVDSRTVLDAMGADKLLGRGDMLFIQPGDEKPTRGQAPLIVDKEINRIVDCVAKQAKPEFRPDIQKAQEGKSSGEGGGGERDEMFEQAVQVVMETRQASTSNLQRRLRLGYTRAARIIDQMEAAGIIGPSQGAKPREIYADNVPEMEEEIEVKEEPSEEEALES